jgi:alpha-ribazole phosphatase
MIFLLRHGEIETDEGKCYTGQMDLPLTKRGIKQAERWKKYLASVDFKEIYSSDLSRCLDTARIIAGGEKVVIKKALREIALGQWEGLRREVVKEKYPATWKQRGDDMKYAPPGGESFFELYQRAVPEFRKITENKAHDILIVTHAGVIRSVLTYVLGMPLENMFRVVQDYSGMNLIKNMGDTMKLIRMNMVLD